MNVTKIILTRCQIFHLKCTIFNFFCGSFPDPTGGAFSAPQSPSWIWEKGRKIRKGRRGKMKRGRSGQVQGQQREGVEEWRGKGRKGTIKRKG